MALQLVRPAERGELSDGAEAAAPEVEVGPRPEHAEDELEDEREELGRDLLRRQLLTAGARPPQLLGDRPAACEKVLVVGHGCLLPVTGC